MKQLLPQQAVTAAGDLPSAALVEIIQRLVLEVEALGGRLDAIAAVAAPTGGATVDAQARTAINAIRTAAA